MISRLFVQNFVLIQSLDLDVEKGLTVITGETGSGKSVIMDALLCALGQVTDYSAIGPYSTQSVVVLCFDVSTCDEKSFLLDLLLEHGILNEQEKTEEITIKRILSASKKSKAFINDVPVSSSVLKQIAEIMVHVHGQNNHVMKESFYKKTLDTFASQESAEYLEIKKKLHLSYENGKQLLVEKAEIKNKIQSQKEHIKHNQKVVEALSGVNLNPEREEDLIQKRFALQNLAKITHVVKDVLKGLDGSPNIIQMLYGFQKSLEKCDLALFKEMQNAFDGLDRACIELKEVESELKSLYQLNLDAANEVEKIEEELFHLRHLAREFQCTTSELSELYQNSLLALESEGKDELDFKQICQKIDQNNQEYFLLEKDLFEKRVFFAKNLSSLVMSQLPDLKLENASFEVSVSKDFMGQTESDVGLKFDGGHKIDFLVAMNSGQSLQPLAKVASGGEMARLTLILKTILSHAFETPTIIFDEIDIGVGGAVASAIGRKLYNLSKNQQVLCITHAPQVAVWGDCHWFVQKSNVNNQTVSYVESLDEEMKSAEIARMLAGEDVTEEAKKAAIALKMATKK
ncbi:MAG: hypothetical protein C0432_02835 [Candidatus Puniceispirillum sp.]|nr:hypothetical protein [Candidatus Pelagibacter sp.]MBA4283212.1 hypothetical protein [Candidatus Puniceispirillum sp.]